jgi:hypothetical protein
MADDKKEVFLEADKEVPGQKYVCLSFISPNKVLADKNQYFFTEFMKDYEIQYRVKATESFIMARAAKVQDQLAKAQDLLDNLLIKSTSASVEDLSGVVATIKEMRVAATAESRIRAEATMTFMRTHPIPSYRAVCMDRILLAETPAGSSNSRLAACFAWRSAG